MRTTLSVCLSLSLRPTTSRRAPKLREQVPPFPSSRELPYKRASFAPVKSSIPPNAASPRPDISNTPDDGESQRGPPARRYIRCAQRDAIGIFRMNTRRLCISVACLYQGCPTRASHFFSFFPAVFPSSPRALNRSLARSRTSAIAFILALNRGCASRYATSIMMYRRDERDEAQYGKAMAPRLRRKNRPINRPISSSATYRPGWGRKEGF